MTYLLRLVKDGLENEGESAHPTSERARTAGAAFTGSPRWWWNGDADVSVNGRLSAYVTPLPRTGALLLLLALAGGCSAPTLADRMAHTHFPGIGPNAVCIGTSVSDERLAFDCGVHGCWSCADGKPCQRVP